MLIVFAFANRDLTWPHAAGEADTSSRLLLTGVVLAAGWSAVVTLFLTIAPKLASGEGVPTIVSGDPLAEPLALELVSLHEGDAELFLRYRLPA